MKHHFLGGLFGTLSLLLWLGSTPWVLSAQTAPNATPRYGAAASLGPILEPCATPAAVANSVVVGPTDDWEQTLTNATPGTTILLRGGTYQARDKLWLPAGAPDQFITIQPYDCESVTLYGTLRPLSYTIIAGLTIEAAGTADTDYVIRVDSEYRGRYWGPITQVILRHNRIRGGQNDAIRLSDDVSYVTITGNEIDGGATGHNIFVTAEKKQQRPDQILITNNKLTKLWFTTPAEDMFQVRDVGYVAFTYNTCAHGLNMEQCVDIKTTTVPLLIAHNLFDGTTLHQLGAGEDRSDGCMVIHENDQVADQHIIEYNYFQQCQGTSIRFASGNGEGLISSGLVRYNLFFQTSASDGDMPIVQAQNLHFFNNTMICGRFKLGNAEQTKLPNDTLIKNNIFYKTNIEDNTRLESSYTCAYNLLFHTTGDGFAVNGCANTLTVDPQFAAAAQADFRLLPISPARYAGEGNSTLGALAVLPQPAVVDYTAHIYLPLVQQTQAATLDCAP
ncbi:MAG: hypothetical protein KF832_10730 [Caldilineaceae bacterium]|nr:hypothetical protein [Caldilineaceae bacterium]